MQLSKQYGLFNLPVRHAMHYGKQETSSVAMLHMKPDPLPNALMHSRSYLPLAAELIVLRL